MRAQARDRSYEYEHPGDLLHLDTKKLARIPATWTPHPRRLQAGLRVGWENAHVAIRSLLAYVEVLPAEDQHTWRSCSDVEHFASGAPSDDRQRAWLRLEALQSPMPSTRDPAHLHPALHPQNQRQSRTLHPHTSGPTAPATRPQSTYSSSTALATIVTVPTPASA